MSHLCILILALWHSCCLLLLLPHQAVLPDWPGNDGQEQAGPGFTPESLALSMAPAVACW